MDKLIFAQFLDKLGYKQGDYVVYKDAKPPYTTTVIYKVKSIEEIHHLVTDWGTNWTGPRIVWLDDPENPNPSRAPFLAGTNNWKKVEFDELPERIKNAYARANQVQT